MTGAPWIDHSVKIAQRAIIFLNLYLLVGMSSGYGGVNGLDAVVVTVGANPWFILIQSNRFP